LSIRGRNQRSGWAREWGLSAKSLGNIESQMEWSSIFLSRESAAREFRGARR